MILATYPTIDEVRERLGLTPALVGDAEMTDVLLGETEAQAVACDTRTFTADLRLALFRRCARSLAAKGVPLGVMADEFGGSMPLRVGDAEITRLESGHMKFALGGTRL